MLKTRCGGIAAFQAPLAMEQHRGSKVQSVMGLLRSGEI